MSKMNIIRAWKDREYRNSLTAAERALLPENPAGLVELLDADLAEVAGGDMTHPMTYNSHYPAICCPTMGCGFTR